MGQRGLRPLSFLATMNRFRRNASARALGVWKRSGRPQPEDWEGALFRRPGISSRPDKPPVLLHSCGGQLGPPAKVSYAGVKRQNRIGGARASPPWRAMRAGSGETEPAFPFDLVDGMTCGHRPVSRLRLGTKADAKHPGLLCVWARQMCRSKDQGGPKGARGRKPGMEQ